MIKLNLTKTERWIIITCIVVLVSVLVMTKITLDQRDAINKLGNTIQELSAVSAKLLLQEIERGLLTEQTNTESKKP